MLVKLLMNKLKMQTNAPNSTLIVIGVETVLTMIISNNGVRLVNKSMKISVMMIVIRSKQLQKVM
jgi:hypothetical protein